jgi:hypothetical protein
MNGLTIVKDGVRYDVPAEIEGKGDRAVQQWLESASAQEARHADGAAPKRVRATKTPLLTEEG